MANVCVYVRVWRRLALIASKVLHEHLLGQLEAAEQQLEALAELQEQQQQQEMGLLPRREEEAEEEVEGEGLEGKQGGKEGQHAEGMLGGGAKAGHGHGGLRIKKRHRRFVSMLGQELFRWNPHTALVRRVNKGAKEGGGGSETGSTPDGSRHPLPGVMHAGSLGAVLESTQQHGGRPARTGMVVGGGPLLLHGLHGLHGAPAWAPPAGHAGRAPPAPRKLKKLHALAQAQTHMARGGAPLSGQARPLSGLLLHPQMQQVPQQSQIGASNPLRITPHGESGSGGGGDSGSNGRHLRQRTRSFTAVSHSPLDMLLMSTGLLRPSPTNHSNGGGGGGGSGENDGGSGGRPGEAMPTAAPPRRHSQGLYTAGLPQLRDHALLLGHTSTASRAPAALPLLPEWPFPWPQPSFSHPPRAPQLLGIGQPRSHDHPSFSSSQDPSTHRLRATAAAVAAQQHLGAPADAGLPGGRKVKAHGLGVGLFGHSSLLQRLARSVQGGGRAGVLRWGGRRKQGHGEPQDGR